MHPGVGWETVQRPVAAIGQVWAVAVRGVETIVASAQRVSMKMEDRYINMVTIRDGVRVASNNSTFALLKEHPLSHATEGVCLIEANQFRTSRA